MTGAYAGGTRHGPAARRRFAIAAIFACVVSGSLSCQRPDSDAPWSPDERDLILSLSPPGALPPSPGNRVADNEAAALLGRALFFDTGLSANGAVACATCHQPGHYFTDGRARARGIGEASRNAPTLLGAAYWPFVFWDGRKDSLWAQALGPLEADVEHGLSRAGLAHAIADHYRARFEALFGPLADLRDAARFPAAARPVADHPEHPHDRAWRTMTPADQITVERIASDAAKAIEAYERKLLPGLAPFDAYVAALRAGDPNGGGHLDVAARRGLRAFIGTGRCVNCHNGPLLADGQFHNLGLPQPPGSSGFDLGRTFGAAQVRADPLRCGGAYSDVAAADVAAACAELTYLNPRFADFQGAFKTPTLRNVDRTAPYMHAGQFASLEQAVAFYATRPGKPLIGHRDLLLDQVPATLPVTDLVAFLRSLTGPLPDARWLGPDAAETATAGTTAAKPAAPTAATPTRQP